MVNLSGQNGELLGQMALLLSLLISHLELQKKESELAKLN